MNHYGVKAGPYLFVHVGNDMYAIPGGAIASIGMISVWAAMLKYQVAKVKTYVA